MKVVVEDRRIDVSAIDNIYSLTKGVDYTGLGDSYAGDIQAAIEEANAECEADPALKIRITIETVAT